MKKRNNKFENRLSTPEPHIVAILASIDEIRGELRSGLRMTPQAITNLKKSVIITSAAASTRIEGAKLTDKEVEKIMQGLAISKFSDRDSQEVQGYLETLQNIFDSHSNILLREGAVKSLHHELLKYSLKDELHSGEYKRQENTVGVLDKSGKIAQIMFETTPAYLVQKEMQELIEWTNEMLITSKFHPLLIISNFIVEFLKIHPFEDGNGRLSRVLTNLLLLQSGYQFVQYISHEQIIEKRKDEYYIALRKSQETFNTEQESIFPWLNFFLSVIKEQGTEALSFLNEEKIEETLSPKQYKVWKYLSDVNESSPMEIVKATGVGMPTVRQSLEKLLNLEKVKRIGQGRGTRYIRI